MSQIDHLLWCSVRPDLTLNTDAAIYRLWRSYRDEGNYLGVPISAEVPVSDTEVQQGFFERLRHSLESRRWGSSCLTSPRCTARRRSGSPRPQLTGRQP